MGVRGVWVSLAAERGGCRVSFVSVETPSFSGGWLGLQRCAQPTEGGGEPGEGLGGLALFTRGQILSARAGGAAVSASPSIAWLPRHLHRCLNCHHSRFTPSSAPSTVTILCISLLQYPVSPGALQNLTHHSRLFSSPSFLIKPSLSSSLLTETPRNLTDALECFLHARWCPCLLPWSPAFPLPPQSLFQGC